MERIGVYTPRESGQTSDWCLVTRKFGKLPQRGKADDGGPIACLSADRALAGASSSRTIRVAAPSVYRKVAVVSICRGASHLTVGTFEMLEPCEGKLSRTVLRGLGGQQWPPGYPTRPAF